MRGCFLKNHFVGPACSKDSLTKRAGQSAVFYEGEKVIGGGVIEKVED